MIPGIYDDKENLIKSWNELISLGLNLDVEINTEDDLDRFVACTIFKNNNLGGTLVLPDYIKKIANGVFCDCITLKRIVLPDSLTYIGNEAFIGSGIEEINIPDKVEVIKNSTFNYCANLKNLKFGKNLKKIEKFAFSFCDSLESIVLPENVEEIEAFALSGSNIKYIYLPNSVTKIDDNAFVRSTKLENIEIGKDNKKYCSIDGVIFNKDMTTLVYYPPAKKDTFYEIPNTVTRIEDGAFGENKNLEKITMNDNVLEIGKMAFNGCRKLKEIELSNSVKILEQTTFACCENLKSVKLPKNLEILENFVFNNCKNLEEITIPETVKQISNNIFNNCDKLTKIKVTNKWIKNHPDFEEFFNEKIERPKTIEQLIDEGKTLKEINRILKEEKDVYTK